MPELTANDTPFMAYYNEVRSRFGRSVCTASDPLTACQIADALNAKLMPRITAPWTVTEYRV
jgi:hypothetical protein